MYFVDDWVHKEKTPVPHSKIISKMKEEGVKGFTTINALNGLLKKGWIRRSCTFSNRTFYVQLRRV
jgi:PII-like signaling protein